MAGLVVLLLTIIVFAAMFWVSGRKYNQDTEVQWINYQTPFPKRWSNDHYGHHSG